MEKRLHICMMNLVTRDCRANCRANRVQQRRFVTKRGAVTARVCTESTGEEERERHHPSRLCHGLTVAAEMCSLSVLAGAVS